MSYLNHWHDYARVIVFIISAYGAFTLLKRHRENSDVWNTKTLDYWYALFMWCVVGMVSMVQGILLDRPITPVAVVTATAVLVTGKGLHKKGAWGGDS